MIQTTRGNEALTVRHQIGIVSGFKIGNSFRLRRNPQRRPSRLNAAARVKATCPYVASPDAMPRSSIAEP
jgi:hypothetical protein